MKAYCCYLIDRTLRPVRHESVRCADDRSALAVAGTLLKQSSCAGVEVWDRGRCVDQLLRRSDVQERWDFGPGQDLCSWGGLS
jgi:hypothetical protein